MEVQYILGRHNFYAFEKDHQPDLKITPAAITVELLQRINEITRLFTYFDSNNLLIEAIILNFIAFC